MKGAIKFVREWSKESSIVGTMLGDIFYVNTHDFSTLTIVNDKEKLISGEYVQIIVTEIVRVTLAKDKLVVEGIGMQFD